MIKHNLLLFLRNIKRSKIYFLINVIGLSTGIACSLLIFLWINDELHVNSFHKNDKRLYQVMEHQQYSDHIMTTRSTPGVLSEALEKEIPEIEYGTTTTWINSYTLTEGEDNNIKAKGYHVSSNFFQTFSYDLIHGEPEQVLKDKYSMAISESTAKNLFGTIEKSLGKIIQLDHEKSFTITGVFKDTPTASTYTFDFVMPLQEFLDENEWATRWGNNGPETIVVLREGSDRKAVEDKIAGFIKERNEGSHVTLFLKPFSELYLYGNYEDGKEAGGRIEYVIIFLIVAILILTIACINFMNLSTARATRKAKEIGVKKSLGAQRGSLMLQYMGESIFTAIFSLFVACLVVYLVLPEFNTITDKKIQIPFLNLDFWWWSTLLTIITGIVAGSYPAFYLTGFNPVNVLKGKLHNSFSEIMIRKGLVIFQFFLSVVLIICVIVVSEQLSYLQSKNLGYKKENLITIPIEGRVAENPETFIQEVKSKPGIVNASVIGHSFLGRNNNTMGVSWPGKSEEEQILFENVRVGLGLTETLNIEFVEGRPFRFQSDTAKIIFNETAIEIMGLKDPIGQVVRLWDEHDLEIIGVAKDFHFTSLHQEVKPLFFMLNPQNTYSAMISLEGGKEQETLSMLEDFYKDYNPGFTMDYEFQDVKYANLYASEQRVSTLSRYFAVFAVLISCLGLLGLSIFTAERRTKEIGIRKILGSSSFNIVLLLSGSFTKIVLISITLALPISYYILKDWLSDFAFHTDLKVWYFMAAAIAALCVAWLTVASQAFKVARVNPVNCLRDN